MIETILIMFLVLFWVVILIGGTITERRERKERMQQWDELARLFCKEFTKQEVEVLETPPPDREYEPVCPRGYEDCIWDPARIQCKNPEWYKELYGDMTPKEALNVHLGCNYRVKNDPNEEYYCYDDEEK